MLLYLASFALGCLSAFGYIARRFPEAAWRTARSSQGAAYMAINGGLSCAALYVMVLFDWEFIESDEQRQVDFVRVIVSGFGALALMRTRFSFPAVGGGEAVIGPGQTIDSILGALENQVVQSQATSGAGKVSGILEGLTYRAVGGGELVTICLRLVKGTRLADKVTEDQLNELAEDLKDLDDAVDMEDPVRLLILGLALNSVFGLAILEASVEALVRTHSASESP